MTIRRVYTGRNITMFYKGSLKDFAEVAMSPQILAACMDIAETRAKPYAISISPHGPTGLYVRSWKVRPSTTLVRGMRRVCARLINDAPHAALVEWGGKKGGGRRHQGQHILQRVRDNLTGRDGATDPDLMG